MNKKILIEIISLSYTLLFIYAGVSKLLDYERMQVQLAITPLLAPISGFIAWVVPTLELLISIMLLIPRWRLQALYACLTLMILFELYILGILKFSPVNHIPCTCGGLLQKMTWNTHIIFNLVFIILAGIGIRLEKQTKGNKSFMQFS